MTHNSMAARVRRLRVRLALGLATIATALTVIHPPNPVVLAQSADAKLDAALAAQLAEVAPATPLEVVVVFTDIGSASGVAALASRFHAMNVLPMAGAVLTAEQVQTVVGWPEVVSITLNAPLKYFLHESVPLVRADEVWNTYGQTGGNATVAVIDSGIDATHPDLQAGSKVIQNVKVLPFESSQENQPITDTSSGHGTHVAGTIGGNGAASSGYYLGIAPDAKLVGLGAGEGINILTATQAYDWVLEHHAEYNIRVVSNSWGSTGGGINIRNPIVIATFEAYKKGILSVFAAGNDGGYDVMNPYSLAPWVLSVAAGKKDGMLTDFSSRGADGDYFKHPDITAPGHNIYAARTKTVGITAADPYPNLVNPLWTATYTEMSGTSMATPHVSGAAALLLSSNPQLSPDQVMDLLTGTATPMPQYKLHEAGHGYLNALAAYEASRGVAGNLPAFLEGQQKHSIVEVLGFDPDGEPITREELHTFTGITAAGAAGLPDHIDHPFNVGEGALYVDVLVTWTPQIEDAYDIEVLDESGNVVVSSGNFIEEPEAALFVPEAAGTYILRIHPFAAVATQYEARVRVAYGTQPAGWPPSTPPADDRYLSVNAIFKVHGVLGIEASRFRSGDQGFINFRLRKPNGDLETGAAANVVAAYADRHGNIVRVDDAIRDLGGGVYRTSFNTGSAEKWAPGVITVFFTWRGQGTLRAAPVTFALNALDLSLEVGGPPYVAGQAVTFGGDVIQANSLATGTVEMVSVGNADVTVSLLDAAGTPLAATAVRTDADGRYSGSLVPPHHTRGPTTLVAEAAHIDPTILSGTQAWYGKETRGLRFPGNLPPTASLSVAREPGTKTNQFYAAINASVADADGRDDVVGISLVVVDAKGRTVRRWSAADFTAADATTWTFSRVVRFTGTAPWTVTLTARDSANQTVTKSQTVQ